MLTFDQTVNRELLQARYLILELGALLDRLEEAAKRDGRSSASDVRLKPLMESIALLAAPSPQPDRAERMLRIYTGPEL